MKLLICFLLFFCIQCSSNIVSNDADSRTSFPEVQDETQNSYYIVSQVEAESIKQLRKKIEDYNSENLLPSLETSFISPNKENNETYLLIRSFDSLNNAAAYSNKILADLTLPGVTVLMIYSQQDYIDFVFDKSK